MYNKKMQDQNIN